MKKTVFIVVLSLFVIGSSFAQEQENKIFPDSENVSAEKSSPENRNTVTDILESTVIEDKYAGVYQVADIKNISKLYWLKTVLDLDDDTAIDNFILINECDFYKENLKDDFKWVKVRAATRELITDQLPTYSDKFKIIVPIDLGRYELDKKGFPLINGTRFKDLRRIEVGGNDRAICGKLWAIESYPRNIFLILSEPFTYDFVPVDEHLAQAFIIRSKDQSIVHRPKELLSKTFNRLAYARIRMSFLEYQGVTREQNRTPVAIMFGTVDGVDIFENPDETGLLSTTDF